MQYPDCKKLQFFNKGKMCGWEDLTYRSCCPKCKKTCSTSVEKLPRTKTQPDLSVADLTWGQFVRIKNSDWVFCGRSNEINFQDCICAKFHMSLVQDGLCWLTQPPPYHVAGPPRSHCSSAGAGPACRSRFQRHAHDGGAASAVQPWPTHDHVPYPRVQVVSDAPEVAHWPAVRLGDWRARVAEVSPGLCVTLVYHLYPFNSDDETYNFLLRNCYSLIFFAIRWY